MIGRMLESFNPCLPFLRAADHSKYPLFLVFKPLYAQTMSPLHVFVPAGQALIIGFHSISPAQELSLHKIQVHPAKGRLHGCPKDPSAVLGKC